MTEVVPLADAHDESRFGAKATGLGAAARAGLPIPPGLALSGAIVDAVAAGPGRRDRTGRDRGPAAARRRSRCVRRRPTRTAPTRASPASTSRCSTCRRSTTSPPRSGRSGGRRTPTRRSPTASASASSPARASAWWSSRCSLPDVAGVMFTQNPINRADERLIEASWGLGEVVVAGPGHSRHVPHRPHRRGARTHVRRQEDRDPRRRPTAAPSTRPSRRSASSSSASTTISSRS